MADKLMYISNNDKQNYSFWRLKLVLKRLDTEHNEPTNQYSIKDPKVVKLTSKEMLL